MFRFCDLEKLFAFASMLVVSKLEFKYQDHSFHVLLSLLAEL